MIEPKVGQVWIELEAATHKPLTDREKGHIKISGLKRGHSCLINRAQPETKSPDAEGCVESTRFIVSRWDDKLHLMRQPPKTGSILVVFELDQINQLLDLVYTHNQP